jgi:hypothetical protein
MKTEKVTQFIPLRRSQEFIDLAEVKKDNKDLEDGKPYRKIIVLNKSKHVKVKPNLSAGKIKGQRIKRFGKK